MTATSGQDEEHWKSKYYTQLDQLEKKEKEWSELESVLKRTVGRLSLAAEGQNDSVDRYISDIRTVIKNDIDRIRLESILDDLSKLLAKIEEKKGAPDQQVVAVLHALLESLELPKSCKKAKQKLLKRLGDATDKEKDACVNDVLELLKNALALQPVATGKKPGFLERIIGTTEETAKAVDIPATASIVAHVVQLMPWPDKLREQVRSVVNATAETKTDKDLSTRISQLEKITDKWKADYLDVESITKSEQNTTQQHDEDLDIYRSCVMSFLDKFDNKSSPSGKISALRIMARDAVEKHELDKLASDLADMLLQANPEGDVDSSEAANESDVQPNIQELLIRLLEQLVVPADFHKNVEEMKARLEKQTHPSDWKKLLKDVTALINSIRVRMQNEKHEFESFLQQVTSRLKEMDSFLQNESLSIESAEKEGKLFDVKVKDHVKDIRNDMNQAGDLDGLKSVVETRLENISIHIKEYRKAEQKRYTNVKKDVFEMQNQMMSLEKESENLKNIIVEKNKQAMFDVLTGIPNRLAYEKKAVEEIARWKRFSNPLSLAVWDIDFFKKVNDTYGHKAGDKVLKTIAQLLNDRIRGTDFLARFGGEEFVMFLPGTKEEETLRLVNDLRKKVEACGFHYQGNAVNITVSCGISSFSEGDTLEKVFERADNALYEAKENGRNQCVIAS